MVAEILLGWTLRREEKVKSQEESVGLTREKQAENLQKRGWKDRDWAEKLIEENEKKRKKNKLGCHIFKVTTLSLLYSDILTLYYCYLKADTKNK